MTNAKSRRNGGSIFLNGGGPATVSFSDCAATVSYFMAYNEGGFLYTSNTAATRSSSNCCYDHLYAIGNGYFVEGAHLGTFTSSCT